MPSDHEFTPYSYVQASLNGETTTPVEPTESLNGKGNLSVTSGIKMQPGENTSVGTKFAYGMGGLALGMGELTAHNMQPPPQFQMEEEAEKLDPEDVALYAEYLGMDKVKDAELLYIAEMAMSAPLPAGWAEHTNDEGREFYYNSLTGVSTYEHPLDNHYRSYYHSVKARNQQQQQWQQQQQQQQGSSMPKAGSESFLPSLQSQSARKIAGSTPKKTSRSGAFKINAGVNRSSMRLLTRLGDGSLQSTPQLPDIAS
mmetsp:Transcript_43771/g.72906  ORF Transcript_43771/g.72906 Transcript_43771/m.72906 type:complete len:256 (-) Transcript_43771:233-1000(-)